MQCKVNNLRGRMEVYYVNVVNISSVNNQFFPPLNYIFIDFREERERERGKHQ